VELRQTLFEHLYEIDMCVCARLRVCTCARVHVCRERRQVIEKILCKTFLRAMFVYSLRLALITAHCECLLHFVAF
jgi:hypothetical protein